MHRQRGCRLAALAVLVALLTCLVFGGLAAGLVWVGDIPLYPPRVTHIEPPLSEPVLPTTSFTLTFDQPMDPETVGAAFSILPTVPGSLEWNTARDQVTFVPAGAGFEPGTTYTLRLYDDARSAMFHRKLAVELSCSFFLPTLLIESLPTPGSGNLGAYPELRAAFSYDLDCALTPQTFTITPAANGQFECRDHILIFRPTTPLAPDTAYQAGLAHTFLAGDPAPRPGVSWSFHTASALSVTGLLPAPGRLLVDLHEPVRITFNRPVEPDPAAPELTVVSAEGEPVPGQVTWEAAGTALVFRPTAPWLPGAEYDVSLEAGVSDGLGFTLQEPVTSRFATLPMIKMPDPVPGAEDVPLDSTIVIPFTRPMDRASVETGLVFTPTLPASYAWDGDTLLITPRGGLAASTHYTVSVAPDVRDATGAPLGTVHSWDLRTGPFLLDARVPTDAPLWSLGTPITLTFALPMDPASVRLALRISPQTAVELSWSDDRRTLVLSPEAGWQPGVEYEVRVQGRARTAIGQQEMGQDQEWPFLTAPSEVHFGLGPNVQVVPATGARTFQALHRGADAVSWHLYLVTPTQFIDLYTPAPQALFEQQPAQVDTAGIESMGSWRQDLPVSAVNWQPITVTLPSWASPGLYVVASDPQPVPGDSGAVPGLLLAVTDHVLVVKRAPRQQIPVTLPALAPTTTTTTSVEVVPSLAVTTPVTATPPATTTVPITATPTTTATTPITATPPSIPTAPVTATPSLTPTTPTTATAVPTPTVPITTTPTTVAAKGGPVELLIWDTELATGAPVVSATVVVYGADGRLLAEGVTDSHGLLAITLPAGAEPLFVISDRAGDVAISGLDATWSDEPDWYGPPPRAAHTLATIPDRAVYNPGDPVRFKSIIRTGGVENYLLPPQGTEVTLSIEDAQGEVVSSQVVTTTAWGTASGELLLPTGIQPGSWQLVTHVAGDVARNPIQVQPVAAADYQLTVHPARSVFVAGEPITVTVSASVADRDSLAGIAVELSVHHAVVSADVAAGPLHFEPAILSIQGTTGADGRWTAVLPPDLLLAEPGNLLLALAAKLSPEEGIETGSYELVSWRPAEYSVELLLDRVGYAPGEQITLTARILDRNGNPAGGVSVIGDLLDSAAQVVGTGTAESGEQGLVHFLGSPTEPGWYRARVAIASGTGTRVEATEWIWVYPVSGSPTLGQDEPYLSINPDRLHYVAGQVARLAVQNPKDGPVLLTIERGEVRAALPIELAAGTSVISLPIQAGDEPNVYLTLSRWGDATSRLELIEGSKQQRGLWATAAELRVPAASRQLSVTLTSDATSYTPGDEATVQVQVTNPRGVPVHAEVCLSVIKAILPPSVKPTAGLFTTFYGPRPHDVATANSLAPERQLVTEPPARPEGEGGVGMPAPVLTGTLPDTVYWAPTLLTDVSGTVSVTFTLPDNPGEWQIVARAVTTDTQVGETMARLVTTQSIAVRPNLPTFLVQGDIVTVTATIQSYLPQPVSATVTFDAPAPSVAGSPADRQRTIHLPAHGSEHVSWQAAAAEVGTAEIAFRATATYRAARLAGRGAARAMLPILPLVLPAGSTFVGQVDTATPQAVLTFTLPLDTLDLGRVDLFLAPSSAPVAYQVYVNDGLWQEKSLTTTAGEHLVLTYTEPLSPALLIAGDNVLRLTVDGGSIYYTASVTTYLSAAAISEPFATAAAPTLRRSYHRPGDDEPVDQITIGDLVEVRLWLDVSSEAPYATIHDHLPAGLSYTSDHPAAWLSPAGASLPATATVDIEGRTVTFYHTNLVPGVHTLSYLARATTGGHFIAPPALLSLPSGGGAWGHSGTTRLDIASARPE